MYLSDESLSDITIVGCFHIRSCQLIQDNKQ